MRLTYGALDLTDYPYMVEFGSDLGAPANAAEALAFLLQDGEIELSSRASNRTLAFNVLIEGTDLAAMASAEAALVAETEKALNTVTLDPEDFGPVTVFDVFRGQVSLARDDEFERSKLRRYAVTVRALPFPRSAAEVTTVTLPATGGTVTSLDACSATTGWVGTINGGAATVSTAGGAISITTASPVAGAYTYTLQKTFAATTTTTKLLMVDWKTTAGGGVLSALGDSVNLPLIAEGPSPTFGYTRTWFYVAAASLAVTRFTWTKTLTEWRGSVPPALTLSLDNVAVTNTNPTTGTGRQQLRSLAVTGSARAPGSLSVESATAALGDTLIYVFPSDASTNGYNPALRQYRAAGHTVTTNSALVSGASEPLGSGTVFFSIPIGSLPRGSYVLMGRLATSGGGTPSIAIVADTVVGAAIGGASAQTATVTTTTAYQTFALVRIQLPITDLDPASATAGSYLRLAVSGPASCTYDELWLFNTTIGSLTWIDCGTGAGSVGGPARRVFIEPATTGTPRPTVRMGHSADRSDSFYSFGVKSWTVPEFIPPQVNVFVVTPNATDATIGLRHYPYWHTHAAS